MFVGVVASGFGISSGGFVGCGFVWGVVWWVVVWGVVVWGVGWLLLRGGSVGVLVVEGFGPRNVGVAGRRPGRWRGSWFGPRNVGVAGAGPLLLALVVGLLVCGCSGGVLLSRSLVGAVPLALGGLASGFGMGPGVSLPRCGRRDGGGVVALLGVGFPPLCVGGGWVGSGLRSGRGWFAWRVRVALSSPPSCVWGGCVGCVRVGRLVPVG